MIIVIICELGAIEIQGTLVIFVIQSNLYVILYKRKISRFWAIGNSHAGIFGELGARDGL